MVTLIDIWISTLIAASCLSLSLIFKRGAWFELYNIISSISGVVGFRAWGGCCWSENALLILFLLFTILFLSINFRTIDDEFFCWENNCGETILFRLERDTFLVIVNVMMEGWKVFVRTDLRYVELVEICWLLLR